MPDLSYARRAVEALMEDACAVERDSQGVNDDVLDESTGLLVRPTGDASTIWTGPCLVRPSVAGSSVVGALTATRADSLGGYLGMLPMTAPRLLPGDVLTVTASLRDPLLVGRRLRVSSEGELSTFAVGRSVHLELL